MAARHGELNDNLVGMLLANLDPDDVGFLTSVSILDHLSPELCREISGFDHAQDRLEA